MLGLAPVVAAVSLQLCDKNNHPLEHSAAVALLQLVILKSLEESRIYSSPIRGMMGTRYLSLATRCGGKQTTGDDKWR